MILGRKIISGIKFFVLMTMVLGTSSNFLGQTLQAQTSITVNSLNDIVADDGQCSFREAISAANDDAALFLTPGECAAGIGSACACAID